MLSTTRTPIISNAVPSSLVTIVDGHGRLDRANQPTAPNAKPGRPSNTKPNLIMSAGLSTCAATKPPHHLATSSINQVSAEPIRFAQAKNWIDDDFNPQMFYTWLVGTLNGRVLIDLDGTHPECDDWDFIAKRAVCRLIGIDEPKSTKKPRRNRTTK